MTSYAVTFLRRGDSYDPDCARSSFRLGMAKSILLGQGVSWTTVHGNDMINNAGFGRHACADNCRTTIDQPWVDDEILDTAYQLASKIVTKRGAYNQREVYKLKEENRHG